MFILIIGILCLPLATCEPWKTVKIRNSVLTFYATPLVTFDEALNLCRSNGVELATFADSAVKDSILQTVSRSGTEHYWIGATDVGSEGSWRWLNGDPVGSTIDWAPGQPDNYGGREHWTVIRRNDLKIGDVPKSWRSGVVCQAELWKTVKTRNYVLTFYEKPLVTFDPALNLCRSHGTEMATFADPEVKGSILQTVSESDTGHFWIGATDAGIEGVWKWLNGDSVGHTIQWAAGQPDNYAGREHWAVIRTNDLKIGDVPKSWKSGVICQSKAHSTSGNVSIVPWKTVHGETYDLDFYDQETGGWDNAIQLCRTNGGEMVQFDDGAIKSLVLKNVAGASVCCFWIGATDEVSEGNWRWLDGSAVEQCGLEWAYPQPDNVGGIEHYATLRKSDLRIGDVPRSHTYSGTICLRRRG